MIIDTLQNALTFNYYANTEMYDERAEATEDTSKLDKEIIDDIAIGILFKNYEKPYQIEKDMIWIDNEINKQELKSTIVFKIKSKNRDNDIIHMKNIIKIIN